MTDIAERPSAELLANHRTWVSAFVVFAREELSNSQLAARDLLAELDAVTRERNEARDQLEGAKRHATCVERERDDARKVTDEMVERAARVAFGSTTWQKMDAHNLVIYRNQVRAMLTAALGGGA